MEKPTLTAYALAPDVPALVPAIPERDWMELGDRRAYRCLPLSIANSSGWEYRSPISFRAFWNGGPALSDIRFEIFEGMCACQARQASFTGAARAGPD